MRRPGLTSAALAATLGAALLTAGCGGGTSDASGGASGGASGAATESTGGSAGAPSSASVNGSADASPTASLGPTSSATGADFAALSGTQIADTAKAAMLALSSVHYQGTIASTGDTGDITLNLRAKSDGECVGQLGIQGGRVSLLAAGGTSYFKGDQKFWQAAAGSAADQIIAGIDGRWVLDSNQDFSQFCDLGQFLGNLFDTSSGGTFATQSTSGIGGQQVVAVQRSATDVAGSVGYVQTGRTHYLLRIARTEGAKQGQLDFTDFDHDFTVQAPPATDVVDPATLASSASPSPGAS